MFQNVVQNALHVCRRPCQAGQARVQGRFPRGQKLLKRALVTLRLHLQHFWTHFETFWMTWNITIFQHIFDNFSKNSKRRPECLK